MNTPCPEESGGSGPELCPDHGQDDIVQGPDRGDSTSEEEIWHDPEDSPEEIDATVQTLIPGPERSSDGEAQTLSFRRWMSTLRKGKRYAKANNTKSSTHRQPFRSGFAPATAGQPGRGAPTQHRKSHSIASSIEFVTAVKSASVTLASVSMASLSRRPTLRLSRSRHAGRSRGTQSSSPRRSLDRGSILTPPRDEATIKRGQKRREQIEELIRTEEGYLADLKALSNAYFNVIPRHPTLTPQIRASAQKNLESLVELHIDMLTALHQAVPYSEYDQTIAQARSTPPATSRHIRWQSADAVSLCPSPSQAFKQSCSDRRSLNISRSSEQESFVFQCTPRTVTAVAHVFMTQMKRFSLYEEYGARCEVLYADMDYLQKTAFADQDYDKAIETLSASLEPINVRAAHLHKALGLKDMLIKPIQRITRYELLFKELCKYTPSSDDPVARAALEDVLNAIRQTCQHVNEIRKYPERLRIFEIERILQERLVFEAKGAKPSIVQSTGRLLLCGTLFLVHRSRDACKGQYAICILYESHLILALPDLGQRYRVTVNAALASASIEEPDNGKGLQCHTTPHAWKLVFESTGKMYEVLLVACSSNEASTWRDRITERITTERTLHGSSRVASLQASVSPLVEEMRSVEKAYGRSGDSVMRRLSVHRAATLGPMTDCNQVIIKNTQAVKETFDNPSTSSLPMQRSQSVASSSRIPVLAPRRSDRINLEQTLSDVWTRDVLPYPGLTARRPEYNLRASANSVIRKLSMASIASNFSKRSMSFTSINTAAAVGNHAPIPSSRPLSREKLSKSKPPPKPKVDFHTRPEAFLPEDFDLPNPSNKLKRNAFRTLTMAMDRPRSPFFASESKSTELKRSNSVQGSAGSSMPQKQSAPDKDTAAPRPSSAQCTNLDTAAENKKPQQIGDGTTEDVPGKAKWAGSKLFKLRG